MFVDQLTRWPIVVPVKANTKEELIRSLETAVMPNHGYMEKLICDQGGAYVSDKFKKVCSGFHEGDGLPNVLSSTGGSGSVRIRGRGFVTPTLKRGLVTPFETRPAKDE